MSIRGNDIIKSRQLSAGILSFVQTHRVTINVSFNRNLQNGSLRQANTCNRKNRICPFVSDKLKTRAHSKAAPLFVSVKCSVSKPPHNELLSIAIMVSGGGRSLQNVCEQINDGQVKGCHVGLVIASKPTAGAISRAEHFGVPTRIVRPTDFGGNMETFSEAISRLLDDFGIDLVVMAGWMHFYQIPSRYEGKVINIHPSLIPSFCGKGYYGNHVHEAVIKFGAKVSGCTVHLADNQYDHGPIIIQKAVPVFDTDSPEELAARVFEKEKEALPEAIQLFVDDRLSIENGIVCIVGSKTRQQN